MYKDKTIVGSNFLTNIRNAFKIYLKEKNSIDHKSEIGSENETTCTVMISLSYLVLWKKNSSSNKHG